MIQYLIMVRIAMNFLKTMHRQLYILLQLQCEYFCMVELERKNSQKGVMKENGNIIGVGAKEEMAL